MNLPSGTYNITVADLNGDQLPELLSSNSSVNSVSVFTNTSTPVSVVPVSVVGSAYNDLLEAGGGNDALSGLAGDDTLTGGGGADVFHFGPGSGKDEITDFDKAEGDKLDLSLYGLSGIDLPVIIHPAAVRVSADVAPYGAGEATGDRRKWRVPQPATMPFINHTSCLWTWCKARIGGIRLVAERPL